MSDETPVEPRLREAVEARTLTAKGMTTWDGDTRLAQYEALTHAIDCGREAIRLLDADDFLSTAWYERREALLARCTEGPR